MEKSPYLMFERDQGRIIDASLGVDVMIQNSGNQPAFLKSYYVSTFHKNEVINSVEWGNDIKKDQVKLIIGPNSFKIKRVEFDFKDELERLINAGFVEKENIAFDLEFKYIDSDGTLKEIIKSIVVKPLIYP